MDLKHLSPRIRAEHRSEGALQHCHEGWRSHTNVEVSGAAPILQLQGAETGQVIGTREITDLPLEGRNFTGLMLLVPGVGNGGGGNNLNISVNGQREFSNSVEINGIEVTGNRNNDTNMVPSPDALQEFKMVTSTYAPEFGRASGGSVLIQTKSGSNDYHGSALFLLSPHGHGSQQPVFRGRDDPNPATEDLWSNNRRTHRERQSIFVSRVRGQPTTQHISRT